MNNLGEVLNKMILDVSQANKDNGGWSKDQDDGQIPSNKDQDRDM